MSMATSLTVEKATHGVAAPRWWKHLWRWWAIGLIVLVLGVIGYLTFLALNWPFTKQAVIDILQERSVRSVTIDKFYRTYWPPGCVAEGISFLHREHKNKPPLITIQKLVIQASYTGLLLERRLSKVRAIDMHVTVPPKQPNGAPNPIMPLTRGPAGPSIVIGTVIADGAVLDFLPQDRSKKPFQLTIDKLALDGVGNNRVLQYRATISNTMPPGQIRSHGVFGPWDADDPAQTPVHGSYQYENANLAVFQGISGTLSSNGNFQGALGTMKVAGSIDVPNFHVTDTSHTRQLTAKFQATVDATDGNTTLENVAAHFDRTDVLVKGQVAGQAGGGGKIASLDLYAAHGRIEDLLDLFIEAKSAPMTGDVSFRAHVEVPPTADNFVKKLKMSGDFGVSAGKFADRETQSTINRLAQSGKKETSEEDENTVLSDLKGHMTASGGVATLTHVSFRVPGATAWMHGTYGLINYKIDLHGHLITDEPSDATTGFKSFLLKVMTPFLKKRGKARVVPFKIGGSYGNPQIGMDFSAMK